MSMIEIIKPFAIPIGSAALTAAFTFLATRYWHAKAAIVAEKAKAEAAELAALKKSEDALAAMSQQIADLKQNMAVIGQAVQPMVMAFQAMLVKQLTHYHEPRTDELLAKLDPFVLSDEEENELFSRLAQRTIDMDGRIPPIERIYAKALPLVIAMVRHDMGVNTAISSLTVVAISTKDEALDNKTVVELKMVAVPSHYGELGD